MRLSSNAPLYIRGVGQARATGGYVDPSTVTDLQAWHEKERARKRAIREAAKAERQERKREAKKGISKAKIQANNEMLLIQAQLVYDNAPVGAEKRKALVSLRRAQERCGIFPDQYMQQGQTVDVATGAAGWLDDNR